VCHHFAEIACQKHTKNIIEFDRITINTEIEALEAWICQDSVRLSPSPKDTFGQIQKLFKKQFSFYIEVQEQHGGELSAVTEQ